MTRVVESVETFILRLETDPARARYEGTPGVRSVYPTGAEVLLVRIQAGEHVAWGESLAPVNPEAPAAIIRDLMAPMLLGEQVESAPRVARRLRDAMRERGHQSGHHADAVAAIDNGLWDLVGKQVGLPSWQLTGGAGSDFIPVYHSAIHGSTHGEAADAAAAAVEAGYAGLKLHLFGDPLDDLARFDAVRAATPGIPIAVDLHWSYDLRDAIWFGRALDERRGWFLEAPLLPEDLDGLRRLAEMIATPIAVGEAIRSRFEWRDLFRLGAVRVAQPDIGRTGISEGLAIATLAETEFAAIAPHHSMALSVAYAAGLVVCSAAATASAIEYHPHVLRRSAGLMSAPTPELRDGRLGFALAREPGLAVEVDEDAVRRAAAESVVLG